MNSHIHSKAYTWFDNLATVINGQRQSSSRARRTPPHEGGASIQDKMRTAATLAVQASPAKIIVAIVVFIVFVLCVWGIVVLYRRNDKHYPVLLSDPIRGSDFVPYPSKNATLHPMVDRQTTQTGIRLPYAANSLLFVQEPRPLPKLNDQVQFTLSFWMKVENLGQTYSSPFQKTADGNVAVAEPTVLLAQNQTQFQVLYDVGDNELLIEVQLKNLMTATQSQRSQRFALSHVVNLQVWQMFSIVLDNRHLDVYKNGKMVQSFLLVNVPELTTNTWRLFPGSVPFAGTISNVRYFDYAFDAHEVARHYSRHTAIIPRASYLFWWTWYKGNSLVSLFY